MVRGALASLLNLEPDIEVVAQVSRGDEVVGAATASVPDVALLDIEMPGRTGLDAADELVTPRDLRHDLDDGLEVEQAGQRPADHRLVFGQEYADHACETGTVTARR